MRIAVIGGGVSGLMAGWLLQRDHEVVLFEAAASAGGHARTLEVQQGERTIAVDTGFIVFNRENYPVLTALFEHLGVPVKESNMSFAVSLDDGRDEYATVPTARLFASWRNLLSLRHWRMVADILRFNREARSLLARSDSLSLRDYLQEEGYSSSFRDRYLIPMAAAIWSAPPSQILDFPARSLVHFFSNHGLLNPEGRRQWFTVDGGSREYVNRLLADFAGEVRCNAPVQSVKPVGQGFELLSEANRPEYFDQVIFACHTNQTLAILAEHASDAERSVLSAIEYKSNRVILHSDPAFMPKNRRCWQSWVYLKENQLDGQPAMSMTYWMNSLQSLESDKPLLVTLNPEREPAADLIEDIWETGHPVFNQAAMDSQHRLHEIQGVRGLWFCGAWAGYGFHEDGAASAVKVAEALNCQMPWARAA